MVSEAESYAGVVMRETKSSKSPVVSINESEWKEEEKRIHACLLWM